MVDEIYRVMNQYGTKVFEFDDVDDAIKVSNTVYGSYVLDNMNNKIHTSRMTLVETGAAAITSVRNAGDCVCLNDVLLYKNAIAAMPCGKVSGYYYLHDAKCINGRYRIVADRSLVNTKEFSKITGYINDTVL